MAMAIDKEQLAAPELHNSEQDDEDQAQDVADDALHPARNLNEDSVRNPNEDRAALLPDDEADIVDRMQAMLRSGQLDYGAFAGEPSHDDEEDSYGKTGDRPDADEEQEES
jgi:hypothetical protein